MADTCLLFLIFILLYISRTFRRRPSPSQHLNDNTSSTSTTTTVTLTDFTVVLRDQTVHEAAEVNSHRPTSRNGAVPINGAGRRVKVGHGETTI